MSDPLILLSLIVFLPAAGAIFLAFVPSNKDDLIRYITLAVTISVLVVCCIGFFSQGDTQFLDAQASMQSAFNKSWIPSFNIYYFMGIDGISFPLIMLTAVVSVLAMGASWSITKQVKGYCILFLLLETGMLGVFHGTRLLPVLRLLGSHAAADVLPHRSLGWGRVANTRRSSSSSTPWSAAC